MLTNITQLLHKNGWEVTPTLLFAAITGSRAYGTDLPTSDTDTRGVFVLPKTQFYGLDHIPQVSDERHDHTVYELGRFIELLIANNPNMLELLDIPVDCKLYEHPLFKLLDPNLFLSKLCLHTFAGYAMTQVRKARGLNKKIHNPLPKERKGVLDFCYVIHGHGAIPLRQWLQDNNYVQERCGLLNVPHFRDTYAVFYDKHNQFHYSGIIKKTTANDVALSSIPKGEEKVGVLSFNKDGYQTYCKDYRQYWDWVEDRNEARYANTLAHGKNYDAKNMMHTFRLLGMAEDIARSGELRVRRPDRDFLLEVREGKFEYDQLVEWAEERIEKLEGLYEKSGLPARPDREQVNKLLIELRMAWYSL